MLQCSCGWRGVNLVPNYIKNTAECPVCHTTFKGILANNAVLVSPSQERDIVNEAEALQLVAESVLKIIF